MIYAHVSITSYVFMHTLQAPTAKRIMGKLKALDEYIRGRSGAQSLVGSESLDALSRLVRNYQ